MKRRKASGFRNARLGRGITSSAKNPLDKLDLRRRAYVAARASGEGVLKAAESAAIGRSAAIRYEKEADVQAAYRQLIRQAIPAEDLVQLIHGGANATEIVRGEMGNIISQDPDWKTRKGYIEMAAEHGGYFEKKQAGSGATMIGVTVNHIGNGKKEDHMITVEGTNTPQ